MALNGVIKPKSKRHARLLQKQKPLVFENDKNALFIKGGRTSETVKNVLKEFASMKKPLSTMYYKKNMTKPFDDSSSLEFFSEKSDSSLFMFGSDSKKRPNNLILGRTFDFQILDMFEFEIEKFISLQQFKNRKVTAGSKPCLIFCGDAFDATPENTRLMNMLIDFFKGPKITQVSLAGFEHALLFALHDEKLFVRSYRILLKKSGTKTPQIELDEVGPSMNLKLRRTKIASEEMYRLARKVPKEAKIKKQKNVSHDAFSSKIGQIHMQTQDFANLTLNKSKGFKRKRGDAENPTNKKKKTDEAEAMELEEEQ